MMGTTVIPSSDDPLDVFLQSAGKFFGKDPTRWEQMGKTTQLHSLAQTDGQVGVHAALGAHHASPRLSLTAPGYSQPHRGQ